MSIFPIKTNGLTLADRSAMFRYIIETFSMYYDAVDVVLENSNDAMILSTTENESYFNFCIHKDGDLQDCIARNTPVFAEYDRMPLFYISPASSYYGKEIGLEKFADDAFMFLEDETILQNYQPDDSIKIQLCTDEELFIKIWGDSRKDPNDVYGVASEQTINGMRRFFKTPPFGLGCFAVIAYKNDIPAANGISVYNNSFMLNIGLGVLPEFRGLGLGKAIMKFRCEKARELGIKAITLQTESGSRNEKIFEKMGFVTKFNGIYYKG